jgi:serine/threonine protein kinase
MQAIHKLKVLHRDAMPRNILRNSMSGQVVVIDFERAEIQALRVALGVISPNRKRKRGYGGGIDERAKRDCNVFMREMGKVRNELRTMMY